MGENKKLLGRFSALATFALMAVIAWLAGAFPIAFDGFVTFMSGGYREVLDSRTTFLVMLAVILAVVVMELPSCMAGAYIQAAVHGQSGKHAISELFEKMGEGNHFMTFFVLVWVEELFARWLFLGVLPEIPFLSSTAAFYVLLVLGNAIWALVHITNFKEQKDRKILRTLPQFIAGFFYAFVFVKYGLLAAVLAHFASNAILFATHKVQRTNKIDGLIIGYGALCAAVSYALMTKPVSDISPWFANEPASFQLEGWGFWDYLKLSVFVSSCIVTVFGLLQYDRGEAGNEHAANPLIYIIGMPIMIGMMYGGYALMGIFTDNVPYRILIVAILVAFMATGASGSAVARTFWYIIPDTFIAICILQALGFWPAVGWLLLDTAISMPRMILTSMDD